MPFSFNKHSCLQRAKDLSKSRQFPDLLYSALEARFCIEAIAYEKLKLYAPRLPDTILKMWQPPQIVKALLEFEPLADQDFTLTVAQELPGGGLGPAHSLGTHRFFRPAELQKIYNKLGSFLHAPTIDQQQDSFFQQNRAKELADFLDTALRRLTEIASSNLDSSLANTQEFKCKLCGSPFIRNVASLQTNPFAICLNQNCQAEHFIDRKSEPAVAVLKATPFKCQNCEKEIFVQNRKLKMAATFKCESCGAEHQISEVHWGYRLLEPRPDDKKTPR